MKKTIQEEIEKVYKQIAAERFNYLSGKHEDLVNKLNRLKKQLKEFK